MSRRWKIMCSTCGTRPVAMARVPYCFTCWPGGPVTPPPCLRCGSRRLYFASGLCAICHPSAIPPVDSCRNCLAWGATRNLQWLCRACRSWVQTRTENRPCRICQRVSVVDAEGVCRLCHKQGTLWREPRAQMDLAEANRRGQQLFIADLFFRAGQRTEKPPRPVPEPVRRLEPHQQLTLFTMPRDLAAHGRQGLLSRPVVPQIAAFMEACLHTYARDHAWPPRILDDVWYGLRILLGLQDHPGAPIKASDVLALRGVDLPVRRTLEVLAAADMLDDDRRSHIEGWFETRIVDLPPQMAEEMQIWFDVMRHGSTSSPRRNPRTITTIYLHTRWTLPTLKVWAEQGHASLREISRSDVLQVLPPSGNPRATLGQGLKSIFGVLKARKVVFLNPTAHLHAGFATPGQPMPLDPQVVRAALDSPDPVRAALVALTAFHGLRPGQLRTLLLADLHDGRLTIGNRSILLAQPVMQRLAAYLAYRNARWPGSPNPHLFIHFRTASRTEPPGPRWVRLIVGPGITAQSLREDRILDEATATGGDARRLCDLFGISITAATRYTNTVNHPDLGTAHD